MNEELLKIYAFYSSILVLKMLFMAVLTGTFRFQKRIFPNAEDLYVISGKVGHQDPDIERVRRAHRNDLENILPFFIIAFLYIQTNPSVSLATNLFRVFTSVRILHTIFYSVWVVPQPARAIQWMIGFCITIYMALVTLATFSI